MIKSTRFTVYLLLIALLFSSCDAVYDYHYHFDNQSDRAVSVQLIGFDFDTTFSIPKAEIRTFTIPESYVEGTSGPYEHPVNTDFESIIVINQDNLVSQKDYLNDDAWEFAKSDSGDFFTDINNDEF